MFRASGGGNKGGTIVGQQFISAVRNSVAGAGDATYQTMATITVPGGLMGPNSKLVLVIDWNLPNSASTKSMGVDFGGSNVSTLALTTGNVSVKEMIEIQNTGSLSIQSIFNSINYGLGATNARIASAIDTSGNADIVIKCKWSGAATTETITLVGYSVIHFPGQ